MATVIDLMTGAKILAQRLPDEEEEFRKEFGFQSSEMDFVSGDMAACFHLMTIARIEIFPYVNSNEEKMREGIEHYSRAAFLVENFHPKFLEGLPHWNEFPDFLEQHFVNPPQQEKSWGSKVLSRLVLLFY